MVFLLLSTVTHTNSITTLTFGPLSGSNGASYLGHTEQGFDIAATGGSWFEAHAFGNPTPSIFAGPIGSVGVSEITVTRSTPGAFSFSSVDLSTNTAGPSSYTFIGSLGGTTQYTTLGAIANINTFTTTASVLPSLYIDMLTIRLNPGSGTTSLNVDNIVVAAVPEPGTILLLGSGLVGLGYLRRRFKS